MANYYGRSRTNYVEVKDKEEFKSYVEKTGGVYIENNEGKVGALYEEDTPCCIYDENDEEIDVDVSADIAEMLVDKEVLIIMESGYEKMRYLTGRAIAINNKKETRIIDIFDILKEAQELTDEDVKITDPTY